MDYRSESLFCVKISKIQSKAGSSFGILLLFVSLSFPVFFSVCWEREHLKSLLSLFVPSAAPMVTPAFLKQGVSCRPEQACVARNIPHPETISRPVHQVYMHKHTLMFMTLGKAFLVLDVSWGSRVAVGNMCNCSQKRLIMCVSIAEARKFLMDRNFWALNSLTLSPAAREAICAKF